MNRRLLNFIGLVILVVLLVLHLLGLNDLGSMIWLVSAFIIVAAAGLVATPRGKDVGNG